MPESHFGEDVAARYDASHGDMFDAAVVEPTVAFPFRFATCGRRSTSESGKLAGVWEKP